MGVVHRMTVHRRSRAWQDRRFALDLAASRVITAAD
jgi:hypothetical protein